MFPYLVAFAALFLAFCVYQNRKSGYQRARPPAVSILEEGFAWIESIEASLWDEAPPGSGPVRKNVLADETAPTAQLANLAAALGESASPAVTAAPVEAAEAVRTLK